MALQARDDTLRHGVVRPALTRFCLMLNESRGRRALIVPECAEKAPARRSGRGYAPRDFTCAIFDSLSFDDRKDSRLLLTAYQQKLRAGAFPTKWCDSVP
jgi:hypothetical protein